MSATHARTVCAALPVNGVPAPGDSAIGISGLISNVSERTAPRFEPSPYNPDGGREDLCGAELRVPRAGFWFSPDIAPAPPAAR